MKINVLMDNNTLVGNTCLGEAGLSFLIEDNGKRILFDTGISDAFIENAKKMDVDLLNIDYVIISHGHDDHTGGLYSFMNLLKEKGIKKKPVLVAHPDAFIPKLFDNQNVGSPICERELEQYFNLKLSKSPLWITDRLLYLGEIPRKFDFENIHPRVKIMQDGNEVYDYLFDDTALVFKSDEGIAIITGCSHSGICNIIEYAANICSEKNILDVIGGLHLLSPSEEKINGTLEYINKMHIKKMHPCHCTSLNCKIELSKVTNVYEVGSGATIDLD